MVNLVNHVAMFFYNFLTDLNVSRLTDIGRDGTWSTALIKMVTNTSFNLTDMNGNTIITGYIMNASLMSWSDNSSSWIKVPSIT